MILTADQVHTQQQVRMFFQLGGPLPSSDLQFFGVNWNYAFLSGVTIPYGDVNPINMPRPDRVREYQLVQRARSAPGNKEATLVVHERQGRVPRALGAGNCQFNLYLPVGPCGDLSDRKASWSYIDIYEGCIATSEDGGTRSAMDSDDPLGNTYSLVLSDRYKIGPIALGEAAAAQITREVIGAAFGQPNTCDGCAPGATDWLYLLISDDTGSAGVQAQVLYSTDGGATFTATTITGIGVNEQVKAIRVIQQTLVVLGTGAYYYADLNADTGVPGAFSKVTTGFDVSGVPNDIYIRSPREIFFCGNGGYLYRSTDLTAGVRVLRTGGDVTSNNLTRIRGQGDTLVAVGASGTVVISVNGGRTWAAAASSATADAVRAVEVRSSRWFTIGTATGRLFETIDGGASWDETSFPNSGTGAIEDIVYATPSVGYFSHTDAGGNAHIYATWSGGREWYEGPRRILNVPAFDRCNQIAVPSIGDSQTVANAIAVVGLAANGSDGVFYVGIAEQL